MDIRTHRPVEDRYCMQCKTRQRDGEFEILAGGLRQRWMCNDCIRKRDAKCKDKTT